MQPLMEVKELINQMCVCISCVFFLHVSRLVLSVCFTLVRLQPPIIFIINTIVLIILSSSSDHILIAFNPNDEFTITENWIYNTAVKLGWG